MTSRTKSLRRIARLYGVVEEMHSVTLRQATATVNEAEGAIRMERNAGALAAEAGRTALSAGEREEWLLSHAEGEISLMRAKLFEEMKERYVVVEQAAREEFLASRIKTEQMKQIVEQRVKQTALEEGRRIQATSDDRYAARRNWLTSRRSGVN